VNRGRAGRRPERRQGARRDASRSVADGRLGNLRALLVIAAVVLVSASQPARVAAQSSGVVSERAIKAAYIYQFTAYVQWPEHRFERADSPLVIGVLGMDSFADELLRITQGRRVSGRTIDVQIITQDDALAGLHVLFIADDVSARVRALTARARPESILTVTDSADARAQGSVINFLTIDQRVRFDVFLDQAEQSALKLNSRLLAVAEHVHVNRP